MCEVKIFDVRYDLYFINQKLNQNNYFQLNMGDIMNRGFREDENELPYLVYSKRDEYPKKSNYVDVSQLYAAACDLTDEGNFEEALKLIDIVIDKNPNDDRYWNQKAVICYKYANGGLGYERLYDEAIKCLNIAIKINPTDKIITENKFDVLVEYARRLYYECEYSSAIDKIDEALLLVDEKTDDPLMFSNAYFIKGLCCQAMGNRDAFEYYDKVVKFEPEMKEDIEQKKHELSHYQGIDNYYFYL